MNMFPRKVVEGGQSQVRKRTFRGLNGNTAHYQIFFVNLVSKHTSVVWGWVNWYLTLCLLRDSECAHEAYTLMPVVYLYCIFA